MIKIGFTRDRLSKLHLREEWVLSLLVCLVLPSVQGIWWRHYHEAVAVPEQTQPWLHAPTACEVQSQATLARKSSAVSGEASSAAHENETGLPGSETETLPSPVKHLPL